jgi:hypothetical protein
MTFVGNLSGRKKILWGELLQISLLLLPLSTGATSLAYFLVAKRWNPIAPWLGLAGGIAAVLVIFTVNYSTRVSHLPRIKK